MEITDDNKEKFFSPSVEDKKSELRDNSVHVYGKSEHVCITDSRGHELPNGKSPLELVVDASEGFIPLWAKNVILRWRFNEISMSYFRDPEAAKQGIRRLFSRALLAWGGAAPVRFTEDSDLWDFEIVVKNSNNCSRYGCTLASAFFPDSGRHQLVIYPKMFEQPVKEQVDTIIHELGHVFGLRHFFAKVSEQAWPSEIFGTHRPFTIMNYGANSELTEDDRSDLKSLYQKVWSKELTEINRTPIVTVVPYHHLQKLVLGFQGVML